MERDAQDAQNAKDRVPGIMQHYYLQVSIVVYTSKLAPPVTDWWHADRQNFCLMSWRIADVHCQKEPNYTPPKSCDSGFRRCFAGPHTEVERLKGPPELSMPCSWGQARCLQQEGPIHSSGRQRVPLRELWMGPFVWGRLHREAH